MKQFIYVLALMIVTAGCSDNQATVEEGLESTVTVDDPAGTPKSNRIERGVNDVDVDTIGMAEFLALKATKYKEENHLDDGDDVNVDTTGFVEYKISKEKTADKPCVCPD
jgi:hypothetical protein